MSVNAALFIDFINCLLESYLEPFSVLSIIAGKRRQTSQLNH